MHPPQLDYRALAEDLTSTKRATGKHLYINEMLCDVRSWRKLTVDDVAARLADDPLAVMATWELVTAAKYLDAHAPSDGEFLRAFADPDFLKHMIFLGVDGIPDELRLHRTYAIARRDLWDALVFLQLVVRWAWRFANWQPFDLRGLKYACLSHPFVVAILEAATTADEHLFASVFDSFGIRIIKPAADLSSQKLQPWLMNELNLEAPKARAKQQRLDFRQAGGTQNSLFAVRAMGGVDGYDVRGSIGDDVGLIIDIGDKQVTRPSTAYLEEHVLRTINECADLSIERHERAIILRWYDPRLDADDLGRIIFDALKSTFTFAIVSVSLLFDPIRIASLRPGIYSYQEDRSKDLTRRNEQQEPFVLCRSCSSYAPNAFCIASVDHPPCCHRSYDELAILAQYTSSTEQLTFDRGICLDRIKGNYLGANKFAQMLSNGAIDRINLHCLREFPHPATALAECVSWRIEELDAMGVMDRTYTGRSPDGKTFDGLLSRVAGFQAQGYLGIGKRYLDSQRFLASGGGLARVGWMNSGLKSQLNFRADHIATEKDCVNLAGLKEHLATWRHS